MADWTGDQREEVARVLEAYAADVKAGTDDPRSLDVALDAIWGTVSQDVPSKASVEAILPMAEEMTRISRAIGEEEDWSAAWESIFPAMNLMAGEGGLDDGEADHPSIEAVKRELNNG